MPPPLALCLSFRFIYTDSVEIEEASILTLFHAADRYDVTALRHLCLEWMLVAVNSTNAAEFFNLADQHNHAKLRKKSAEIIRTSYDEVKATPGWTALKGDLSLLEAFLNDSFSKKL